MLNRIALRVRALLRRETMDQEIDEELRYHLEMETERNVARGMSPEHARTSARRVFGNLSITQATMRDSWGLAWVDRLGQDLRYALRGFRRTPAFSLTVVLTIALGLGLNTAIFTLFNAYVLRPLAVRDPYSLFEFSYSSRGATMSPFSWSQYQRLARDTTAFSETFAYRSFFARIDGGPLYGQFVTGNYFRMLGVRAALGRTFDAMDDAQPGAAPVAVLSHTGWRSKFGGDSSIVGKVVRINGQPLTVIGVARPGFDGLNDMNDVWVPSAMIGRLDETPDPFGPAQPAVLWVIGRLRDDLTLEQARSRLTEWARVLTTDRPAAERAVSAQLLPRATTIPMSNDLIVLFTPIAIAFVLVMLIACANVANMMLARAVARQREIGIRLSLGAERARLIRQFLTESVLLALPAAAVGFLLSRVTLAGGVRLMYATIPPEFEKYLRITSLDPDARVFLFMLVGAVASAMVFGLVPALKATRPNLVQATRGNFDTEFRPSRLRNALVVGQIGVCVLLLIVAGVLLSGTRRWRQLDLGYTTEHIVIMSVREAFRPQVLERLRTRPDVRVVAATTRPPLDGISPVLSVAAAGNTALVAASIKYVSPSLFTALDVPILRGRNFSADEERQGAAVAVITETTARRLWPGGDAVGKTLNVSSDVPPEPGTRLGRVRSARVVGVSRDVVAGWIGSSRDMPIVYYPVSPDSAFTSLLLRVTGNAAAAVRTLDQNLATVDPAAVEEMHSLEGAFAVQLYPVRFAYWVACAIGVIALLLTFTGIYGVLSYLVAQRRKEIGIRIALGAAPASVVALVLRHSLRLAAVGLAIGAGVALAASRVTASYVEAMNTFEPLAYIGALAIVIVACLGAAYIPSLRAARVDPMEALRRD